MAPYMQTDRRASTLAATRTCSSVAKRRLWVVAWIFLLSSLSANCNARAAALTGAEALHHTQINDRVNGFSAQADATATPASQYPTPEVIHQSGLQTCQEFYAQRAPSSLLSGECVLPRMTRQLSGSDRNDLLKQAASSEAAARIFIWHIGPRSPVDQDPLHNSFPSYFLNVSAATADERRLVRDMNDDTQDGLQADAATARRLRRYNDIYWHHKPAAAASSAGGKHRSGSGASPRGDGSPSFMRSVHSALRPITGALALIVDLSGIDRYARHVSVEVVSNLLVVSWRRATVWRQMFMRRQVVLRIPIGSWGGRTGDGGATVGGDDTRDFGAPAHSMLSRMEMSNYGSLSLLRLISFPPVVQVVHDTSMQPPPSAPASSFACSLPAVEAATLLLEEDAAVRLREAKHAATAFPGRWPRGARGRTSSPPSPRIWLVSVLMDVIRLAARALLGRSHDDDSAAAAAWLRVESISVNDGVTRTAAVAAARGFVARVREELGPHQGFRESIFPIALQQMLGSRTLHTHTQLIEEEVGVADEEQLHFRMQWEASLPAGTPMCLALAALPPPAHDTGAAAPHPSLQTPILPDGLHMTLEETCTFDLVWLQLLIVAWVVWELERRVAQSTFVRYVATGLTGMLLLLIVLLWYMIRRLQGASLQLLFIMMALVLGGSTAMVNGALDVLGSISDMIAQLSEPAPGSSREWNSAEAQKHSSPSSTMSTLLVLGASVMVLICTGSGILLSCLVPPVVLRTTTQWCVRLLLVALWGLCVLRNGQATLVAAFLWALWQTVPIACIALRFSSSPSNLKKIVSVDGAPLEEVPPDARQARGYVPPLAVSAGSINKGYATLRTSEARLKRYEEEGVVHTQRALEELAAHLRSNPERYATRLRNPNGVQQWAGTADTETDEEME